MLINLLRSSNLGFVCELDSARYKASLEKESSAWLSTLPSKMVGTHLDNIIFRISIALGLGSNLCTPHTCPCRYKVDETGIHGLGCAKSIGRFSRHSSINNLIKRPLCSTKIPATLEPPGLCRDDGKKI